jgi:charged multivesicular body protein 6
MLTLPFLFPSSQDQDRAILQLKVQKDRLHKYTQKIEIVIKREVEVAKKLLKEDKKQK